jgi:hypothetical protein
MSTSDWIEEVAEGKLLPPGGAYLTYADLDIVPGKVTEGMAVEAIR